MIYGKWYRIVLTVTLLCLLGGCMYPDQQSGAERGLGVKQDVLVVQAAIDEYRNHHGGLLPIRNSEMTTPYYERERIDFQKLLQGRYLNEAPRSSFENGGSYIYLILHADERPEVKVMDLLAIQTVNDLQIRVETYRNRHYGRIPSDVETAPNWFSIDFDKLGMKRVNVQSVYSNQTLPLLVNPGGEVVVDYALEIMKALSLEGEDNPDPHLDLRTLLVKHSPYSPAKSYPYYWKDGQPILSQEQYTSQ